MLERTIFHATTRMAAVAFLCLSAASCYTLRTSIRYGSLDAQTAMSESVFLEMRSELPRTVFLAEECATGQDLTVRPALDRQLEEAGYTLVDSPEEATYVIQINHLRLAETELKGEQDLGDAIGGAFVAGTATTLTLGALGASPEASTGAGVAVGVAAFLLDSHTKHIAHTLSTAVLVTETVPSSGLEPELRYHETEIVSGASKMNLSMEESLPVMLDGTTESLAHLMPAAAS
jgi:hypothetical protein